MNGIGNYVVQSFTVNGVHRSPPTFGVFFGSKETLKDQQITTVYILSAASNYNYKPDEFFKKMPFVISDSTAHNLGVLEEVSKDLNVEALPGSPFCNFHPKRMFDWKMEELCQKLHDCLGGEKLADCFLVDVDF